MGNLGMPEILFILVLALLIFGPRKLPEIGKQVGKALGEFKRASNDLKRSIEDEMDAATRDEARPIGPPVPAGAQPPPGTVTSASMTAAADAPDGDDHPPEPLGPPATGAGGAAVAEGPKTPA